MKCESLVQHSTVSRLFWTGIKLALFVMLLITIRPHAGVAQMFSVGEEGPRFNTPQSAVYAAVEPMTVSYFGSSARASAGQFAFEGPVVRLRYNTRTLDITLGAGGEVTGISPASYFDVGGALNTGFGIYRSQKISIYVPIRIASRYVNMANSDTFQPTFNRFRFGSLTVGGGANILFRPKDDIRIELGGVPSYGFSFATGGSYGGSLTSVIAHGRFYFDRLFGDLGLTAGYEYDFRKYNVEEGVYDYRMKGHSIEIGITF